MNNELLYLKFVQISHIIDKRNKRFNEKTITQGQGRILTILQRKDGISTKDLSEILDIRVTSLNESLNKLEQKRYIKKIPSEKDKRVLLIYLTKKGHEFEFLKPKDVDIFDCLNNHEKDELYECLNKILVEYHEKIKSENPEKFERIYKHRKAILKKYFDDVEPDECLFFNGKIQ